MTTALRPPDFRGLPPAAFESLLDQGAFGEALTAIMMAANGWRPINGKPGSGPQGLDGIFWRAKGKSWQVQIIETKTNVSPYKPRTMTDKKVLGDLDSLFVTAGDEVLQTLYAAIAEALREGQPHVKKHLWRHNLHLGVTRVIDLDTQGQPARRADERDSVRYIEALAVGLEELDREGAILRR